MTKQEAIKRMEELKKQKKPVIDLTFKEKCISFLDESITEIVITNDDFVNSNQFVDFTKLFLDKVAGASGIEYDNEVKTCKQYNDIPAEKGFEMYNYSYITEVSGRRPMPNGKLKSHTDIYEYDLVNRMMKEILNDYTYNNEKDQTLNINDKNNLSEKALLNNKLRRLSDMATHARTKSKSGAQNRVCKFLAGLPKPKKSYIGASIFISKTIPNMENKEVQGISLNAIFGIASKIYGNQQVNLSAPENQEIILEEKEIIIDKDLDRVADKGFYQNELSIINNLLSYADEHLSAIITYIITDSNLYMEAAKIISESGPENDPGKLKCTVKLYMLHESIQAYKINNDQDLISYLNTIIEKGNDQKMRDVINSCYKVAFGK